MDTCPLGSVLISWEGLKGGHLRPRPSVEDMAWSLSVLEKEIWAAHGPFMGRTCPRLQSRQELLVSSRSKEGVQERRWQLKWQYFYSYYLQCDISRQFNYLLTTGKINPPYFIARFCSNRKLSVRDSGVMNRCWKSHHEENEESQQ